MYQYVHAAIFHIFSTAEWPEVHNRAAQANQRQSTGYRKPPSQDALSVAHGGRVAHWATTNLSPRLSEGEAQTCVHPTTTGLELHLRDCPGSSTGGVTIPFKTCFTYS